MGWGVYVNHFGGGLGSYFGIGRELVRTVNDEE